MGAHRGGPNLVVLRPQPMRAQVVGDHHRSRVDPGCVLCLRCHHLELTAGQQDNKLASFQRISSQDPAPLHCGWEVRPVQPWSWRS